MIHSLSGGVIAENGTFTFAKIELDGAPYWYLAPDGVRAGDRAVVPFGKREILREGTVLKTEVCSAQCAPVPMNRIRSVVKILKNDPESVDNQTGS